MGPMLQSSLRMRGAKRGRWLPARLRKRVLLLAVGSLVVGAVVFGLSSLGAKEYTATATLRLAEPNGVEAVFGSGAPLSKVSLEREAATDEALVERAAARGVAAEAIDGLSGEAVSDMVTVRKGAEYDLISIEATAGRAAEARRIANAFARRYVAYRAAHNRSRLSAANRLAERKFESLPPGARKGPLGYELLKSASTIRALARLQEGGATVVPAALPTAPSSPVPLRDALIAAALAFLAGLCLAPLVEGSKNRRFCKPSLARVKTSEGNEP
jgi:uncharacterized protein involved in exopolysaccharide biosynthesis